MKDGIFHPHLVKSHLATKITDFRMMESELKGHTVWRGKRNKMSLHLPDTQSFTLFWFLREQSEVQNHSYSQDKTIKVPVGF